MVGKSLDKNVMHERGIVMKKLLSGVLVLAMLLLAACGGGASPSTASSDTPASASTPTANSTDAADADTSDAEVVLKLGHINPETGNYHQWALAFKALVEEKSGGRMTIDIYPSAQLGYDRELLESVQFGNLDLAINNSSTVSNFLPDFMALDYPFLYKDWNHAMAFISSDVCKEIMNEGYGDNLVGLGMFARGFRSTCNSKRPLNNSDDFKGLKIRVIESTIYIKTFEALGANVTAMSWGEVFTALQQGTIEAVELDYRTLYDERVQEVQKYLSGTEHIFAFGTLMTSVSLLESLDEDLRTALTEAAWESAIATSELQIPVIADYVQKLQDEGMEYNDCDRDELASKMDPVREWFVGQYGEDYLQKIEALA